MAPSINDLLKAFEDPESRPDLIKRLRAGDPELLQNWSIVKRMFSGLGERGVEGVRPSLRDLALGVFDRAVESARKTLLAVRQPEVATNLRGAPHHRFRELYSVGDHEIDLAWMDDEVLIGQFAGPGFEADSGGSCVLYGASGPRQVELEPLGEFEIAAVSSGKYELAIETSDRLIVVPELELPAS